MSLVSADPPSPHVVPAETMTSPLLFQWSVSTLFGWGVFGLNLLRHWQHVAGTDVYCGGQMQIDSLAGMDPLMLRALTPALIASSELRARWPSMMAASNRFDGLVLHGLGNRFSGDALNSGGIAGRTTCAMIFFEDTILPDAARISRDYALIIAGSSWCEAVLRGHGITNVATVIQGVERSIFHPGPRSDALEGRFAVFSGGKLEYRKGQDLVIQGFARFAARHPEAMLVTAWRSPWPVVATTVNRNLGISPVMLDNDGMIDIAGWAGSNGIKADQFIDVGTIPNHLMARVLREMDVAIFPNRCEGGTNLVAMECMACGIPTILSDNTGHKDLIALKASFVLKQQGAVHCEATGTDGWGESDVDEIVEALETAWSDRGLATRLGLAGARAMAKHSWRQQIGELHHAVRPFCS